MGRDHCGAGESRSQHGGQCEVGPRAEGWSIPPYDTHLCPTIRSSLVVKDRKLFPPKAPGEGLADHPSGLGEQTLPLLAEGETKLAQLT